MNRVRRSTSLHEALQIFRERLASPHVQNELGIRANLLNMVSEMLYIPPVNDGWIEELPGYEHSNAIPVLGLHHGEVAHSTMTQPLPVQSDIVRVWATYSWAAEHVAYTANDVEHMHALSHMPEGSVLDTHLFANTRGICTRFTKGSQYVSPYDNSAYTIISSGRPHIGILPDAPVYAIADAIAHEVSHAVDCVTSPMIPPEPEEQEKMRIMSELTAYCTQSMISQIARANRAWWAPSLPYDMRADRIEAYRAKYNGDYRGPGAFALDPDLLKELKRNNITL